MLRISSRLLRPAARPFLAFAVTALVVGASLVRAPRRVGGPCLFRPSLQWTLTELKPGSLECKAVDFCTGQTRDYALYQFDRQAFVELDLPHFRSETDSRVACEPGQRVARVRSTTVELNVAGRRTALASAENRLATQRSGTRREDLDRARVALERAEAARDAFQTQHERARKLRASDVTSEAAWEEAQATMRLRELDVELARRELRLLEAGSRPEEIAESESLVGNLLAELGVQEGVIAAQEIVSPIAGWLRVGAAGGPLASVSVLDTMVVEIAVPQRFGDYVETGQKVEIRVPGLREEILHTAVSRIDRRATQTPAGSFLVAYAKVVNPGHELDEGLEGRATVFGRPVSLLARFSNDLWRALRTGFVG